MSKSNSAQIAKEQERNRPQSLLITTLTMLASLISTSSTLVGFMSPMNVAVCAVSQSVNALACFVVSAFTYFITGSLTRGLVQLCSMAIITAFKLMRAESDESNEIKNSTFFMSAFAGGLMAIFGVSIGLFMGESGYEIAFRVTGALLCASTVYFTKTALLSLQENGTLSITERGGGSFGVLYVLVIATLTSVNVFGVNLGRVTGIIVLLFSARKYKITGGAIIGALTSCGVILCSSDLAGNTVLLATAGLICGICAELGAFPIAVTFMIVNIVGLLTIGLNGDTTRLLTDAMVASVAFLVLPQRLSEYISKLVGTGTSAESSGSSISARLVFASKSLSEIRSQMNRVASAVNGRQPSQSYSERVCETVCKHCKSSSKCWNENYSLTSSAFNRLEQLQSQASSLSIQDVSTALSWCGFKSAVHEEFSREYAKLLYEQSQSAKMERVREIMNEQIATMEYVLDDLGADSALDMIVQRDKTTRLKKYLVKNGYTTAKACVYADEQGSLSTEIFVPKTAEINEVHLCADVSEIVERELGLPHITVVRSLKRILMCEKPTYSADTGFFSSVSSRGEVSGDTVESEELSAFETALILSDGMGTGRRAQLDSLLAVNLCKRILKAGIRPHTAVKMLNSMLTVKGWEESFATLDLAKFNRKNGRLELVKAGATPSYIYRSGKISRVEEDSFPLGILSEYLPHSYSVNLTKGDRVLMLSDGLNEKLSEKLSKELALSKKLSAQNLAQRIGELALAEIGNAEHDDISVAVLVID